MPIGNIQSMQVEDIEDLKNEEVIFYCRSGNRSGTLINGVAYYLKQQNPDLLISIHLNSASSDTIRGVSTYYRYIGFRPLSMAILNHMLELGLQEYGNVGNFNFGLSGPTDYPNCLVEVAFLSNKEDEKKILSPSFHKAVAKKIVEGIEEFLKNL